MKTAEMRFTTKELRLINRAIIFTLDELETRMEETDCITLQKCAAKIEDEIYARYVNRVGEID